MLDSVAFKKIWEGAPERGIAVCYIKTMKTTHWFIMKDVNNIFPE